MNANQSCGFTDKHVKIDILLNQKPRLRLLLFFFKSRRRGALVDYLSDTEKALDWQASIFQ